jgi:hypothetical protein
VVYDARYWREQAALCLEIAGQISDQTAAAKMRATAHEYSARATELDRRTEAPSALCDHKPGAEP